MNHRTLPVLLAALSLAACKREPAPAADVISRDRFVAANVAVRTLPETAQKAQREAALKKAGVTDRQLRAWVTVYARQPETLAGAWEEIAFKVDSIGGAAHQAAAAPGESHAVPAPPPAPPSAGGGVPFPPPEIRDESGRVIPRRPPSRRLDLPEDEEFRPRRRPAATVQ